MSMRKYMLALHDDPSEIASLSPEEIQGIIEKYKAWADGLAAEGRIAASEKLRDEPGRVLRQVSDRITVTDGPFSETKEVLGGFFVVLAESYDDAVELCRSCPHLEFGGTIELREVEPVTE